MSGSNPKYLPIPKKIPYNIRLPKPLLDKLNAYAELTGKTTTDIVIGALNDFIKDKTVYNTYLSDVKGISIKLPVIADEKALFIKSKMDVDETDSAYDSFTELTGYSATTEAYEFLKIPNNLDKFTETFGYITPVNNVAAKGKHSGIEFAVLPDVYAYYDNEDVTDSLYCFYLEVEMDKLKSITLIDYMDAINKANDVGNLKLKNTIISCVNELKELKEKVDDGAFDGVEAAESYVDAVTNAIIKDLEAIANKYNSGNIIKLGENMDDAVVTAELNENPDKFHAIIYDKVEFIVGDKLDDLDEIVADKVAEIVDYRLSNIEKLVRDAKSKDEILTAIADNKIKTKK